MNRLLILCCLLGFSGDLASATDTPDLTTDAYTVFLLQAETSPVTRRFHQGEVSLQLPPLGVAVYEMVAP